MVCEFKLSHLDKLALGRKHCQSKHHRNPHLVETEEVEVLAVVDSGRLKVLVTLLAKDLIQVGNFSFSIL